MSSLPLISRAEKNTKYQKFRTDIQALRGFAVLIVLFYHAQICGFSAGFLGVDVFFVISGFLITGIVKKSIERGDFNVTNFYFRRAKRLLPAAYVTYIITALLAPFLLGSSQMQDFEAQLAGAVTFTSNVVLWLQSGYFDEAAIQKPLLHIWSLAIEGQFYFILPVMMVLLPRRLWKPVAGFLLMASLLLCLLLVQSYSSVAFYSLPTRGWELALGAFGALIIIGRSLERLLKFLFWPALAILLILPAVSIADFHPGPDAVLICLATLVIILRKHPLMLNNPLVKGLGWLGNISYSLYLVHWPIWAFLNSAWIGKVDSFNIPFFLRLELLGCSFILAWLLHRFIEEPFRRADIKLSRRVLGYMVSITLCIALIPFGINRAVAIEKDYAHARHINGGFGGDCDFRTEFSSIPECRNSDQPEILFWGDSLAMQLVTGVLGTKDGVPQIVQATKSVCGPFLGLAPTDEEYNEKWAESCIDFNDSVVAYLDKADSIQTVVLSSIFMLHLHENRKLVEKNYESGEYRVIQAGQARAMTGLKKTVDTVRSLGKKVIVVAPPPVNGVNIGLCLERLDMGLPVIGDENDCRQISINSWKKAYGPVLDFLAALQQDADVEVIHPGDYLCESGSCETFIGDTYIYSDGCHFSDDGAVLVANNMNLVEKIEMSSR